jgi:hypothetical protein
MTGMQHPAAVGVFLERGRAREAVRALKAAGFGNDRVRIVTHEWEARKAAAAGEPAERIPGSHAARGAALGAAGAAAGALLWGPGIVAGLAPGVGWVAGAALLAALTVVGGAGGWLVGRRLPESDARFYAGEVRAGRTVVTVRADGEHERVRAILCGFGGYGRDAAGRPGSGAANSSPGRPAHINRGAEDPDRGNPS